MFGQHPNLLAHRGRRNCCTICGQQFKRLFVVNMQIVRTAHRPHCNCAYDYEAARWLQSGDIAHAVPIL